LMCNMGLNFGGISERFGINFIEYFAPEMAALAPFINDGLLFIHGKGLEITQTGRLFIRNIAMQFDAHLRQETTRRYCKTI
jgi:oxygen-independent coproporphyrinogen III oxidase